MTAKLPSELDLLDEIYRTGYEEFAAYSETNKTRSSKIWVPIDIEQLARKFDLDPDIIFGRLYYHLNEKYSHEMGDGTKSEFFLIRVGSDIHCVNFPYLSSILASLKDEQQRFRLTTAIAGLSLGISIVSILIASLS
ncbi:MAG: hypothetical protein ACR2OX_05025 [Methyloligellaceae bacterium]